MAIPSDQRSYSSLRDAVSRILGEPGGASAPSTGIGTGGGPQQSSDIVLGNKPGTVSGVQNTPFEDPNTVAARQAVADAKAATAAMQNQLNSLNAPVAATPAATPAAATPAAAKPALMTLNDYDRWMRELYNQKMFSDYGGNVKFRDPSEGSWTDWLKAHGDRMSQAKPVFNIGGSNYGAAGQTTMIDPTTGMAQGTGVRYAGYGAAYRPQTGDYAKDWQITNMVKGGSAPSLAGSGGAPGAYPGSGTWQQQQQYWKDLDTYNKANKLGAYK